MFVWKGPAVVVKKLSGSTYLLRDLQTDQLISRTVVNVRAYKATEGLRREPTKEADLEEGELMALLDADGSDTFDVVRIIDIGDADCITVKYYGTTNPDLKGAHFTVVHQLVGGEADGGLVIGNVNDLNVKSWTAEIARADLDGRIIARQ